MTNETTASQRKMKSIKPEDWPAHYDKNDPTKGTNMEPVLVGDTGFVPYQPLDDLLARAQASATIQAAPAIGEVTPMPGTSGFTMAVFKAADTPVGTKLYAAPMVADPAGVAGISPDDRLVSIHDGEHMQHSAYGGGIFYTADCLREVPLAATVKAVPSEALDADDVEWVVNDNAELGVKIGNQFFFLYKGSSLVYEDAKHDNGEPMMWRPVFKREFGECAHPINHADYSKIGTVSLGDSEEWKPLNFAAPLADKTGGGE